MYLMQYGITLPADYDMAVFREIVRKNGHLLDTRAGLGFKAYLMQTKGLMGASTNYYGSIYIWTDAAAMAYFLVGGGAFERIIRGLGRLAVDHWLGLAVEAGPARKTVPTWVRRSTSPLPASLDRQLDGLGLTAYVDDKCRDLSKLAQQPNVHTTALAIDPLRWNLVQFIVGAGDGAGDDNDVLERYEVLHVSTPDLEKLPRGRTFAANNYRP